MPAKNLYKPKEKEKSIYSSSGAANRSNTAATGTRSTPQNNVWNAEQSTPRSQSNTVQKIKREKSPSERDEEAVRTMLDDDAVKERQRQTAPSSTAQYNSSSAGTKAAAGKQKTAQYGNAAGQFGEQASYSGPSAAKPTVGNQKATPYGGAAAAPYSSPAAAKPAIQRREKTPSEQGEEAVRTMLEDEGLLEPPKPEENEVPAARTFTTGVGRSDIIGAAANAGEDAGTTQAIPEELLLAAAPDLAAAGIDMNTVRAGLWIGDQVNQIAEDSYLASGTSPWAFIGENILSGVRSAAENGWNGFMNYALPFANVTLDQQMGENEQRALMFGGDFRQHADLQNAQLQEVRDGLPEAVETLRLHDAAAYQQSILDRYDPHGAYIPIGEGSSILGQGFFQMLLGAINPAFARGQQFFSASDSMVQQGRDNGASDEQALLGGTASGFLNVLNNMSWGGLPFTGDSFADDLAMRLASTDKGRAFLKAIFNIGGESLEEVIGTFEDALILNSVTGDDRGFLQTIKETAPEAIHAGLISLGPSSILSSLSFIPEYRDARIVDEALDIMNNGGMLTDTKLADAKAAMQRLMGDGHNSWNGVPYDEWTDTLNKHLSGQLSPAAHSAGNAADLSGIDTSNLIMFPTLNDTNAQTNAAADSNAIPFPTANGTAAAQNGQQGLSTFIGLPTGERLAALVNAGTDSDNISSLTADNPAAAQNSQQGLSTFIGLPTGERLAALVDAGTDSDGISSLATTNPAASQNGQQGLSTFIGLPTGERLAALTNTAAENGQPNLSNRIMMPDGTQTPTNTSAGDNSIVFPGANNTMVQNGRTDVSETASQTGLPQNAADVPTELTAKKAAGDSTLHADPATNTASLEMIAEQNAKIREQALEKGKAKEGGQAEMSPETKNGPESTGKTGETSFSMEEMSVEEKKDVADAVDQEYNENKVGKRVETIDRVKHYYDDNGNLYRVKNDLQPNCEYELNGYEFQTDDICRIQSAEGDLHLKDREGRLPIRDSIENIGKGDQRERDNRGHLIGDQFDGANGLENMVPQDAKVNQKDFRNFENKLAAEVRSGKDVRIRVQPVYKGDSRRPSSIEVTYRINGEKGKKTFRNGKEPNV